jgi:hypothetical protein
MVPNSSGVLEFLDMLNLLKSTVLGVALLAGTALVAQAQSVSSLPPKGSAPATSATTQPPVSPPSIGLSPGASSTPTAPHYQSTEPYASNPAEHPYSASVDKAMAGPKPN